MKLIADADALIKLTKCGAKEAVVNFFEVLIPPAVKREAIEEGEELGYADARLMKANLDKGLLKVVAPNENPTQSQMLPEGGEREVYSLFCSLARRLETSLFIATDDQRVIKRLSLLNVPILTPAIILVILYRKKAVTAEQALNWLAELKPSISEAEYIIALNELSTSRKED